jgi:hypothetical protein
VNRLTPMSRCALALVTALAMAACGSDSSDPKPRPDATLAYTDPGAGKLRLIKAPSSPTGAAITLQLVVGDQPVTGYSAGFNVALARTLTLDSFTPGSALAPGTPAAAAGAIPTAGPLAGFLVTGQSQRASGTGAVVADTALTPGSVLYSFTLKVDPIARAGVVFDGTAADFTLPSGGLRDRSGATVVDAKDVAIGKLEVPAAQ